VCEKETERKIGEEGAAGKQTIWEREGGEKTG